MSSKAVELAPKKYATESSASLQRTLAELKRQLGSYHYVSGVDASSSATLAAYLHSLTNNIESSSTWLGGKTKSEWKITKGCFCSFNAFSRVDVRVEVKIPGGVEAYVIDQRNERHNLTQRLWTEVYLSALLRSILYADDATYRLAGYRKLDPIKTLEDELRFLAAAEQCFPQGSCLKLSSVMSLLTSFGTVNRLAVR